MKANRYRLAGRRGSTPNLALAIGQARAAALERGVATVLGPGGGVVVRLDGDELVMEPASLFEPEWYERARAVLSNG